MKADIHRHTFKTTEERFWAKVDRSGDCWVWTACKISKVSGYGRFWVDGKMFSAHRYSWELANGPIPTGKGYHGTCVCHHCDNQSCVNPDHLFLSDIAGNQADMVAKGRSANGSQHGCSRLCEDDIPHIRDLLRFGFTQQEIAWWFGVDRTTISSIKRGETWGHVRGEQV